MGKGEGLGGCYGCIKYLVFAFNFIFWLVGCALVAVGIWALVDKSFADKFGNESVATYIQAAAIFLLIVGGIIMFVGFCGCCGAIRESQCMLGTFFVFLFIFFVALVGAGIYFIVARESFKDGFATTIKAAIDNYDDPSSKSYLTTTQNTFECCGAYGATDYGIKCIGTACGCKVENLLKGCADAMFNQLEEHIYIFAGVAIGMGVIMLLGMIFSMMLCCAIRDTQV
ncbi:CD9 antigen [Lingula anatina]|uniref:Tetraspanin n=1 Tax=Lingula anatina TaxID=7574 RepID=A0A1S3H6H2_LINAN|nr:CD9 antigen [Lingula anatina]|eukprot:XP_013380729.1 CD9 antigen [Lingula anatina]